MAALSEIAIRGEIRAILIELYQAYKYALDTNSDQWQFAVELASLQKSGATDNDMRWLIRKDWVLHKREVTVAFDGVRVFLPIEVPAFPIRTCFVLSETGALVANCLSVSHLEFANSTLLNTVLEETDSEATSGNVPTWDQERRELSYDGTRIKRFKCAAANQEAILAAFQEEGWPSRIDDPLIPGPEQDSKRRLSDTVRCLNRNHIVDKIHFRGDGTGEGVVWERLQF